MKNYLDPTAILPSGESFVFWEKEPVFDRELHVCAKCGNDETGDGSLEAPFKTINRAAALATAGTRVIIHAGEYRECVVAQFGGDSPEHMVSYEAAGDGEVVIKASEVAEGFARSTEFSLGFRHNFENDGEKEETIIWEHELDREMFHGYNPFGLVNALHDKSWLHYSRTERESQLSTFWLRRGMVYVDGKPLRQVELYSHLDREPGTYWVEENGLKVHFRMPDNGSPEGHLIEVSCREQCFTAKPFQNYIRVKGLTMMQAANGAPDPQVGALSCNRGNHWIIEDNIIKYSNTVGMDIGGGSWGYKHFENEEFGYAVIRRNQIMDSGVAGILGLSACYTLVEDNLIARTGWQRMEYGWESGALKFHNCIDSLFRRNIFRECYGCEGLWLDCNNVNDRVTQNLFLNVQAPHGMILMECNRLGEVIIDNNIFWNAKLYYDYNSPQKNGTINIDSSEWNEPFAMHVPVGDAIYGLGTDDMRIVHNLICNVDGYGYAQDVVRGRMAGGRGGTSRNSTVLNNVFYDCRSGAVRLPNHDNTFEGNYYSKMPQGFLVLAYPAPSAQIDLAAWQRFENMDLNGGYAAFKLTIDDEALTMTLQPDRKRINWDKRETIGYSSIKKVAADEKITTDYFGNVIEGDRMPGPFDIASDELTISIDPRKL